MLYAYANNEFDEESFLTFVHLCSTKSVYCIVCCIYWLKLNWVEMHFYFTVLKKAITVVSTLECLLTHTHTTTITTNAINNHYNKCTHHKKQSQGPTNQSSHSTVRGCSSITIKCLIVHRQQKHISTAHIPGHRQENIICMFVCATADLQELCVSQLPVSLGVQQLVHMSMWVPGIYLRKLLQWVSYVVACLSLRSLT